MLARTLGIRSFSHGIDSTDLTTRLFATVASFLSGGGGDFTMPDVFSLSNPMRLAPLDDCGCF